MRQSKRDMVHLKSAMRAAVLMSWCGSRPPEEWDEITADAVVDLQRASIALTGEKLTDAQALAMFKECR